VTLLPWANVLIEKQCCACRELDAGVQKSGLREVLRFVM